jgi:hypothetical protein
LIKIEKFANVLNENELIAWDALKAVIEGVLGKNRVDGFKVLVKNMLESFQTIKIKMNLKLHFLNNHIDEFAQQSPLESDEQGERFHQVTIPIERRFKGKKLDALLADVCWLSQKISLYEDTENDGPGNTEINMPLHVVSHDEYLDDSDDEPDPKRARAST